MRDLLTDLERWRRQGKRVALARVVDHEGSGPRDPGAAMAVNEDGEVVGSVSGGCVEGAVVAEALEVLASGDRRLVTFGYSDEDAFAVGLTCGGTVHLYLEPVDSGFDALRDALRAHRNAVLVTVVEGPGVGDEVLLVEGQEPAGHLADPDLDRVVLRDAEGALASGATAVRRYGAQGQANEGTVTVFVGSFAPPPRLLIFGAVDFTAALVRVAKVLGYHVTVCDAREVFATPARFPLADEVVVDWPHRHLAAVGSSLGPRDAVCVLTHDAKFDVPAIVAALATEVGYLGAMGSRRTTEQRAERLRAEGVSEAQLARLLAPIGLDLGARTPEETAVAICAEMIAHRTGREAPRLRDATGPIH
ncbi:MAG: XdhC family protein [Acidimicrobiales bacterium]|nr:XdhC family protein [Acidimicrobiales bacterium]